MKTSGKTILKEKINESLLSVIPVCAIVLVLIITIAPVEAPILLSFFIGAVMLIFGMGLFTLGAETAMMPMGEYVGSRVTKTKKLWLIVLVSLFVGIMITLSEPDLMVLAGRISSIEPFTIMLSVAVGVGVTLVIAMLRIIFNVKLKYLLIFFYAIVFILAFLVPKSFLAISFDSGGVTTGPITVPFIMALGVGIATTIGGKNSSENSFGLIALCSVGPILAVLLLSCTVSGEMEAYDLSQYVLKYNFGHVVEIILETAKEVAIALGLIVVFFAVLQAVVLKLPKKRLFQIAIGISYTFVGLVIFLSAVKIGFMPLGYKLGVQISESKTAAIIFSLALGMIVVLAEPAVQVLNKQVEDITEGTVSRRSMMIALSIGVGLSICLSIVRIIYDFNILIYLIPGYMISLGLSFFVPGLYTAIAFDSGGVASGPLTSSFILPFAVGVCAGVTGGVDSILSNAFGIVAMVAMAPLITIQLLGFRSIIAKKISDGIAMKKILSADDEQIINFM